MKFGDLVSFDITYKLLKNNSSDGMRYRLGVFCVCDTNFRLLLAGLAFICEERAETFEKMFQLFFAIHRR